MSLTDRPVHNGEGNLYPRWVGAVVHIIDHRPHHPTDTWMHFACGSETLEPQFHGQPAIWFDHMLDRSDRGAWFRAEIADWAETVHPDQMRVTVTVDGVALLDETGPDLAEALAIAVADAERAVCNP